jgi:hypothetical protein
MNGETITQPSSESELKERKRECSMKYFEVLLRRTEHLFNEQSKNDKETFAEFFNEQQGKFLEITAKQLGEAGIEYSFTALCDEVNKVYEQGGTSAVASFAMELSDRLDGRVSESMESENLIRTNIVDKPLPQMANIEGGRFDPSGKYLELHLDALFAHPEVNFREKLRDELAVIAKNITTQYPDLQAVVGESWLLDRPGKNIGFTIIEDYEANQDSGAARAQMILKDGSINEERAQTYIETGELPYKVKFGYMPVEEFLTRYLPQK